MTADELWEKYSGNGYSVSKSDFLAALKEYGEHVKAEAVKVCVNRIDPHPDNALRKAIIFDCAAAIEKMPMP